MIYESALDKILYQVKKLIPKPVFEFFQPAYHRLLAFGGPIRYGFPSRGMKVIGVTGTKGKSTTVYMITKILESAGHSVAAIGSLGFKIKDKEWPNTLKMTMPGRFRLQRFLSEARKAGCEFVVLEVTSEGIKEFRHLGIDFDTAVFVNIHREHLENHGSFENYLAAKRKLFQVCKKNHVINVEDPNAEAFLKTHAEKTVTYGIKEGDVHADDVSVMAERSKFVMKGEIVQLNLAGEFNVSNAIAAIATTSLYGVSIQQAAKALESVNSIPGRMQFIQTEPFRVVVDYAHTPDSLEAVYKALKQEGHRLICVLGAAGGGRDKWKRPEFGAIAEKYCDEIFLTDEDPYEEDPNAILDQVQSGIHSENTKTKRILDRREAIRAALGAARPGDTVVITGKGSEISMAVAGGKKIPWSDSEIVKGILSR
ncbi:MAG TPA: UDP-N-acetylmuramoyl-L-alanyl-D-glutamate--2,6-diaminopimelate ligase [Candidatus Paceibacterota bacterium]|nr:UDP-N-acetylmuramoyl-L-alanyl-D-glutamate--2,6-diaminopimelate ligase [Candidatus Paceibacterota bacterium]